MEDLIKKERIKIAKDHNLNEKEIKVTLILGFRLIKLGYNFLITKWYLRAINKKGKIIFTNKKPDIENKGYAEIGHLTRIWSNVNRCRLSIKKGGQLIIGKGCRINGPTIAVTNKVIIGNRCRIAPEVYIMDGDFHAVENRLANGVSKPIIIEDDAWVATRAMVLKGVRIGRGAVVAAGSVVTRDVPDYTVVAGVPAKTIKKLSKSKEALQLAKI